MNCFIGASISRKDIFLQRSIGELKLSAFVLLPTKKTIAKIKVIKERKR